MSAADTAGIIKTLRRKVEGAADHRQRASD